jgi:hypothetical protein
MKTEKIKVTSELAETLTLIRCYLRATGTTAPDLKLTDIQYSVHNFNNVASDVSMETILKKLTLGIL